MGSKKEKIEVIIPKGASTKVDWGLVELTRQIGLKTKQSGGYGLGGTNGYGIEFENDIFMMHPFCWCEDDDCKWCSKGEANFLYKPTGCKITWYKYIGRDQEKVGTLPKDWLQNCINSLWKDGGCYFEFDLEAENGPVVSLCFNVSDPKATVVAKLSEFSKENAEFWDMDSILDDISFASWGEKSTKEIERLDRKYPKLREEIRIEALKTHKDQMAWHQKWIDNLEGRFVN